MSSQMYGATTSTTAPASTAARARRPATGPPPMIRTRRPLRSSDRGYTEILPAGRGVGPVAGTSRELPAGVGRQTHRAGDAPQVYVQARDEGQTGCHESKGATRPQTMSKPPLQGVCHTGAMYPLLVARLHVDLQRVVSAACR